ncbi:UNKNOWN [Stylonychia lemnae]|uniref:Band 7 domain-containing protein n=1 Tax=Stylonychia lemnae TaxID=5949 RepID=A0A078BAN1_STYLE|nr:UNKNOWN [Stylonychia lemnae]|eukprot:CDW91625.1 UNKNOWN [Stylonychia lemnae]
MPNNQVDQLIDDVQGSVRGKTHLIQLYTTDPDEGPRLISDFHPQGIPIVVVVDPPSCCYYKLNIPHGIVSLEQVWGKHTGQMSPGYHCCYCSHKRIAAMITKNAVQFNTPIEACPTKDNVRVSVDIGITFHIGKEETRAKDCEQFLYYLGANKLQELLEQESEESIRNFIRTQKVNRIRDIKSELTSQMMAELNNRFNQYGVYVEQVNVMNVIIPKDLRIALQQATAYDVFLQNQVRFQENVKLRLMNEENKKIQTLKRENQKKMLELNNHFIMEEISLQKFKVNTETDQQIRIIQATQNQEIKMIQAQVMKNLAEQRAKKQAEQILAEAKAYKAGKMIEVEARKLNLIESAKARLESAQQRLKGQLQEADAENDNQNNLQMKRKHEQRMKKTDNLRKLMKDKSIVIGGQTGENLLDYFKETGEMVDDYDN